MGTDRKRWNRALKRKIDWGILSEEDAQSQFWQPMSKKVALPKGIPNMTESASSEKEEASMADSSSSKKEKARPREAVGKSKNWHFKGEGKGGSLGLSVGSGNSHVANRGKTVIPPAPNANTQASVQEMFDSGYYRYPEKPFWDGKDIWKVVIGTHCLWKNVATGKRGGGSTKTEVFHGECHGWEKNDVIIS